MSRVEDARRRTEEFARQLEARAHSYAESGRIGRATEDAMRVADIRLLLEERRDALKVANGVLSGRTYDDVEDAVRQLAQIAITARDNDTEAHSRLAEVEAGCDIQKPHGLYRQVRVVIGPGKTQAELDLAVLRDALQHLLNAVTFKTPTVNFNGAECWDARVPVEFVDAARRALRGAYRRRCADCACEYDCSVPGETVCPRCASPRFDADNADALLKNSSMAASGGRRP